MHEPLRGATEEMCGTFPAHRDLQIALSTMPVVDKELVIDNQQNTF